MVIGFIGTGSIAAAIVRGLCEAEPDAPKILLSPRSLAKAKKLADRYPTVSIGVDNQEVVDGADVLIICLRPCDTEALADLEFSATHTVISVMAGVSLEILTDLLGPVGKVARAIPLPAVAEREGVTAIFPPVPAVKTLFDMLGRALPVADEDVFNALSAATATIAAHCDYMATISDWLVAKGIADESASAYVSSMFAGLAPVLRENSNLAALAQEHATPGGINALFLDHLKESGHYDDVERGLEKVFERTKGRV